MLEAIAQVKIEGLQLKRGQTEVDANEIVACDRLETRYPDAQIAS